MNKAWVARRTKKGLAHRQVQSCQRQLRRAVAAKQPLPISVTSAGLGVRITMTLSPPHEDDVFGIFEDDWEEQDWED